MISTNFNTRFNEAMGRDNTLMCWPNSTVQDEFKFNSFCMGLAVVTFKRDNQRGTLNFTRFEGQRVYYDFRVLR